MAGSPFYARIKRDVMTILASVPQGRVVSIADLGRHLDVVPRHVAYILASLDELERETLPWHRAVSSEGRMISAKRIGGGQDQAALLAAEGIAVRHGVLDDIEAARISVEALASGVDRQVRPPGAPAPRAPRGRS